MPRKREVNGGLKVPPDAPEPTETKERSNPDFFQQLQQIPPEDWQNGFKTYVYRTLPVIDRRDTEHFLCKVNEPFDEDYLMRNFGSGKYYLRLNNGSGETIASKTVALHNPAFPPKVSPDEVVQTDPRNETYFKVWGPKAPTATAGQPVAATADSTAVQELSKLASKVLDQRDVPASDGDQPTLTSKLVDWALSQTSKEREASDPTRIAALLKELKALLPQQQQPADGLALVDHLLSVVQKINPPPTKPEREDPLEYVDKVLNLADKLRPRAPAIPADDGSSLASVAAIVAQVAELLKQPLAIAMQVWAASKARTAPGGQPAAPEPVGQPGAPPQQPPRPASPEQNFMAFIENITPTMILKLESGADGGDFAGWIYEGYPDVLPKLQTLAHPSMPGVQGAPVIIAFYRTTPHWPRIALHEQRFSKFVEELCQWKPEDDERAENIKEGDAEPEEDDETVERMEV